MKKANPREEASQITQPNYNIKNNVLGGAI